MRAHGLQDQILGVLHLLLGVYLAHRRVHLAVGIPGLRAVCLIDDDRKALVAQIADAINDKRELLDGGDDDLLAVLKGRLELG